MVLNPTLSFAGKTIWDAGNPMVQDRIGTNRATGARYYPFGDEITSTANDATKFGTYHRDGFTGLDYADQRYYASGYGRFNSPDPSMGSLILKKPGSWNRYAYVGGDPVNSNDADGLGRQQCSRDACQIVQDPTGGNAVGRTSDGGTAVFWFDNTSVSVSEPPLSYSEAMVLLVAAQLSPLSVGGYVYIPAGEINGAEAYYIFSYDSNGGFQKAFLVENSVDDGGFVSVGLEIGQNNTVDPLVFYNYLGSNGVVQAGSLFGPNSGTFGYFGGLFDVGAGGYFSFNGGGGTATGGDGDSGVNPCDSVIAICGQNGGQSNQ
jgi:RHS repeat-associated protein